MRWDAQVCDRHMRKLQPDASPSGAADILRFAISSLLGRGSLGRQKLIQMLISEARHFLQWRIVSAQVD